MVGCTGCDTMSANEASLTLTTLCPTFLAVSAVFFATLAALCTGPARTLLIEKNVFMVLKYRFRQLVCIYLFRRDVPPQRRSFACENPRLRRSPNSNRLCWMFGVGCFLRNHRAVFDDDSLTSFSSD